MSNGTVRLYVRGPKSLGRLGLSRRIDGMVDRKLPRIIITMQITSL